MHHELAEPRPRLRVPTVLFALCGFLLGTLSLMPPTTQNLRHLLAALWLATLVRAVYVMARRRATLRIRSGWVLVIALVVVTLGLEVAHLGRVRAASAAPNAAPIGRCVGIALANWDALPSQRPIGWDRRTFATVTRRSCTLAARNGMLNDAGAMDSRSIGPITQAVVGQMRAEGLLPEPAVPADSGHVERV